MPEGLADILQGNILRYYENKTEWPIYTRAIYSAFSLDICEYLTEKIATLPDYVHVTPLYGPSGTVPLHMGDGGCHPHVVHADDLTVKGTHEVRTHSFDPKDFQARARYAVAYGKLCFTVIKACLAEKRVGLFVHFAPYLLPYVTPHEDSMRLHLQFAFFRSHNPRHVKE